MIIIGITGGSGAGKTTALSVIQEMGGVTIDCDAVYHQLIKTCKPMLVDLKVRFPGVVRQDKLDRKALSEIVFKDSKALSDLNSITHLYIGREVERRISDYAKSGGQLVAVDAIALIESSLYRQCTAVVYVTAPEQVRVRRLVKREGISEEYALSRIRGQKPDSFFLKHCDYVLENNFSHFDQFKLECRKLFEAIVNKGGLTSVGIRDELFYNQKNVWEQMSDQDKEACEAYCQEYKNFLDRCKTERLTVKYAVELAEARGFVPYVPGEDIKPGTKIYVNNRGKALYLAVMGEQPLSEGINIAAAHVDSPRLDLKQLPLYEDGEIAYLKTHYYGGIRKYQWVTIPLALHGLVVTHKGDFVEISIGEEPGDPQFTITDLLPHLGADQNKKTLAESFKGESLNILFGGMPCFEDGDKERVKLGVLKILKDKYNMTEEDFLSAEFELVPAFGARDVGLDRSFIGSYGQDDRACAWAGLRALFDIGVPQRTAVTVLADKEEIGSEGVSGMKSKAFECFIGDLCDDQNVKLSHCFARSFCLSIDVCNGFDPNYPEVSEKRNNAKMNYGMGIMKYTGSRGKSGSNDASAEIVGGLRRIFASEGVIWQMGELGKVDQGGGGTVAMFMSERNIDTIDAGVPVLSMHSPFEVTAKADNYMTYKGVKAVFERMIK